MIKFSHKKNPLFNLSFFFFFFWSQTGPDCICIRSLHPKPVASNAHSEVMSSKLHQFMLNVDVVPDGHAWNKDTFCAL